MFIELNWLQHFLISPFRSASINTVELDEISKKFFEFSRNGSTKLYLMCDKIIRIPFIFMTIILICTAGGEWLENNCEFLMPSIKRLTSCYELCWRLDIWTTNINENSRSMTIKASLKSTYIKWNYKRFHSTVWCFDYIIGLYWGSLSNNFYNFNQKN